jgi:hypothetical protein
MGRSPPSTGRASLRERTELTREQQERIDVEAALGGAVVDKSTPASHRRSSAVSTARSASTARLNPDALSEAVRRVRSGETTPSPPGAAGGGLSLEPRGVSSASSPAGAGALASGGGGAPAAGTSPPLPTTAAATTTTTAAAQKALAAASFAASMASCAAEGAPAPGHTAGRVLKAASPPGALTSPRGGGISVKLGGKGGGKAGNGRPPPAGQLLSPRDVVACEQRV